MAQPFEDWYKNLPVVTRTYTTACFLTTLAVYLDLVSPLQLYLNLPLVWSNFEVWRVITNFLFYDRMGINFIFHMFFLVRHSKLLEEGSFRGKTADFLYMYIFGGFVLVTLMALSHISPVLSGLRVMFLAPCLAFMVVYVWGRRNPHLTLSLFGLFNFTAPYLPWVILGFGFMLGQPPALDLLGIVAGHFYYFFADVYPQTSGRRVLKTPGILRALFDQPDPLPTAPQPAQ
ncbi:hypothetical protein PROFUN_03986 [Planoprotostelium fungivorum]|uniref:Derlin n=1 Tax=Planoprotostelium fungivorum TaxID=1890364 RepID=A0A2P6NW25_9EUKA|nr:hypothetical protein PROFUN_03986 [Planoprotostelium fungivorum]